MAIITSNASGLWSAGATWVGGVAPVNNDSVVIAAGHVVEFDADLSGFADGIAGITVTETLKLTRTAGVYYMKIKAAASIAGAGTFDCGTLANPIPFAAKHTITGGAAWWVQGSGGLTMTVYAAEPVIKTVLLTALEPIGETVIAVDTSVLGDIWAAGDTIRIDDINQAAESEERVIAAGGIAAGTITITVGLTAAKSVGALLHLITRNVRFIAVGATGFVANNFGVGKLTVAGGEWKSANYRIFQTNTSMTISGGTFSGNAYVAYMCTSPSVTGGKFSGNTIDIYSCPGPSVSGGTFSGDTYGLSACPGASVSGGIFKGNLSGLHNCPGVSVSGGAFSGNSQGLNGCSAIIKNAIFSTNTQDIYQSVIVAYNTLFGSAVENVLYTSLPKEIYSESFDHDQVAGAFRAWTKGGVTTKQAVTFPVGYTSAMQTVLENATVEGYWQKEVVVGAGASVNIAMNLRKDVAMAYLPRVIVFNKAATDPFAGGAGLYTFTMTNSVDTWEDDLYTYTNATAEDVTLVIRCQGMNAANNLFSAILVEQINVDLTMLLANLAIVDTVVDAVQSGMATAAALAALQSLLTASASILANVTAGDITQYRGDYWSINLTTLGDLTDYVTIDFMIKRRSEDADTDALLWVRKNASGLTDGLLRVNGAAVAAPYASTDGSLTPDTPLTLGTATLITKAIVTKDLRAENNLCFEIQVTFATGPTTKRAGMFHVSADVVRAIG